MLPMYAYADGVSPGQYRDAISAVPSFNSEAPAAVSPMALSLSGNMPPSLPTSFGGGVQTNPGTAVAPAPTPVVPGATPAPVVPGVTPPAATTPGTPATTPTSAYNAFTSFADSAGMKFAMEQAMKALNEQYAAHGQLQSGAAAKGISDYAQNMALQNYFFPYMNLLQGQQNMGAQAGSAIAGVGSNFGNTAAGINGQIGGAIQNGADALSNGAILNGSANAGMWGNIGSALGNLGSSILQPSASTGGIGISDRRLKTNIVKLREAKDGLGEYEWNWRAAPSGEKVRGVIADEVEKLRPWAHVKNFVGQYSGVNYATLGSMA